MNATPEELEDADDVAIFDERMAALQAGTDCVLSVEVSAAILAGESLEQALRRFAHPLEKRKDPK